MIYEPKEYKLSEVKVFTEDVRLLRIKSNINPLPGQFFQISVLGIGEGPFASCSYNKNYVDILVRNVGSVTSSLFKLKKGDRVFIRGPYGKGFPIKKMEKKNLIMAAGGTGIAPITSLIEYVEKNRKKFGNIWIYFGFRDKNYVLLKKRLDGWKKKFKVIITLDKKERRDDYEEGFIYEIMEKYKPECENAKAFLCGPEIMMESITEKLNKFGLDNNKIYWSMERRMECGIGSCGRCLLQDVYVCKDGPVFRYDKIKSKLENETQKT